MPKEFKKRKIESSLEPENITLILGTYNRVREGLGIENSDDYFKDIMIQHIYQRLHVAYKEYKKQNAKKEIEDPVIIELFDFLEHNPYRFQDTKNRPEDPMVYVDYGQAKELVDRYVQEIFTPYEVRVPTTSTPASYVEGNVKAIQPVMNPAYLHRLGLS